MESDDYWQVVAQQHAVIARLLAARYPGVAYMTCEDMVSEGALQLVKHCGRFGTSDVPRYLFQAARSKLHDHLRWLTRQQNLLHAFAREERGGRRRLSMMVGDHRTHTVIGVGLGNATEEIFGQEVVRITPSPEQRAIAAQALEYYLSQLLPKVRQRLLASLGEGQEAVAQALRRTKGAIGAGNWKARRKLRRLRQAEEARGESP